MASRSWLAIAGALLAAGALAGPAVADVRSGNTITAFPDRDMIAAEGDYSGDVTVEVLRNGVIIGRTTGPAQSVPGGTGLEVNHGPAGAAQPGDCWDSVTPDIRGGDLIRVTDGAPGADTMVVGGVTLDPAGPQEVVDASGATTSIVLAAGAVQADGSPLALGNVTAEVRHKAADYRAAGAVARDATGAVTVTYSAPFGADRGGGTQDQRRQSILAGDHMLVYSPVAAEVTIAELGADAGPAPGCESAPMQADAVTSSDDAHVNLVSGDLSLSGTARAGTTAVDGVLTDSTGATVPFSGELSGGDGPQTWTAAIPRDALLELVDGPLVASANYTTTAEAPVLTGATLKIGKDLVAPEPPASTPAPGVYTSAQTITLDHSDADPGTRVHYTANGSEPTASSLRATGPFWVTATQTIKALAIDPAGNPSAVSTLAYRIEAPAATAVPAPPVVQPAPAPAAPQAAPVAPPAKAAPAALRVGGLRMTSRRSARTIARSGLAVAFTAPAEVTRVRVQIMRGRTLIAARTVATPAAGRHSVRLGARQLRQGGYTVVATPVSSGRVTSTKISVRIGR